MEKVRLFSLDQMTFFFVSKHKLIFVAFVLQTGATFETALVFNKSSDLFIGLIVERSISKNN